MQISLEKTVTWAYEHAMEDLKKNYNRLICNGDNLFILAGQNNHMELWARDAFFGMFGSVALGEYDVAVNTLDIFSDYQKEDGQIALRIEDRHHVFAVLGVIHKYPEPKAVYKSTQLWSLFSSDPTDATAHYVIAACNYINVSQDEKWLDGKNKKGDITHRENLERAADWLSNKIDAKKGLVKDGFTSDWADMTFRRGYVMYSNVCAWYALESLGKLLDKQEIKEKADLLKKNILNEFWLEEKGYFADWITLGWKAIGVKNKKHTYFAADGNILAVAWGLADEEQGKKIYQFIDEHHLNEKPIQAYYPHMDLWNTFYSKFYPYDPKHIFGWWGPWEAIGRLKIGQEEQARQDFGNLSRIIVDNGGTFEALTQKEEPVRWMGFYHQENGASMAAGPLIYAAKELERAGLLQLPKLKTI